jgi:hypothetical protein
MAALLALNGVVCMLLVAGLATLFWYSGGIRLGHDPPAGSGGNGGAAPRPPAPFSGPGVPSRLVSARTDELARSA